MIRKSLVLKFFDAAYMQRWNDKLRPCELFELDKQGHKMCIAYFLGRFAEAEPGFNWQKIIEGTIFDLLVRLVITDIKPPIFYKIKADKTRYRKLTEFVIKELNTYIEPLGEDFKNRFIEYLTTEQQDINKLILDAAHNYASNWEFAIIARLDPNGYEIPEIQKAFQKRLADYADLKGIQALTRKTDYKSFIDLCGYLRFQARWSNLHRVPRTSVLGHSAFVAVLSYIFSHTLAACPRRMYNNFFTGLFHDLPEVLTRDIIAPVKRNIEGLSDLIKEIEKEEMEQSVYPILPGSFLPQIRLFTENEFDNIVWLADRWQKLSEIGPAYNEDRFKPRDGRLVKAADDLAAFIEAWAAIKNGGASSRFREALYKIKNRYANQTIAGINFGALYADF